MTNHNASNATDNAPPSGRSGSDAIASELAWLLERAGIMLPPERMAEVAVEYESFREHIALVNRSVAAQDEPAVIFVPSPRARAE